MPPVPATVAVAAVVATVSPVVVAGLVAAAGMVTWLVRAWFWPVTRSGRPVRGSKTLRRLIKRRKKNGSGGR